MTRIIGIDPGLSGAVAIINGTDSLIVIDMPTMTVERNGKAKRQVSASELADIFSPYDSSKCHVYVEKVSAMAGQGVSHLGQGRWPWSGQGCQPRTRHGTLPKQSG